MPDSVPPRRGGLLRRMITKVTASDAELDAQGLRASSRDRGAKAVSACNVGERASVSGTIRALTLRPVGGVPALEAELFDGSGTVHLVWLGRRKIAGIDPGRVLTAKGRVTTQDGTVTIYNPAYELHA